MMADLPNLPTQFREEPLFTYAKAQSPETAHNSAASNSASKYIGGGTNLIDLMKEMVEQPSHLVDVSELKPVAIEDRGNKGVLIGAAVTNSDLANHPLIRANYPVLSRAILSGASPQLRNMATTAGNIMQRTRCYYFYDTNSACNKRVPGSGCDAIEGFNRMNAVLGCSKHCIAAHPSDMAVALACLGAVVETVGSKGQRQIPFVDFHKLPGDTPHIETVLEANELITGVLLPAAVPSKHWCYLKVRDRASYEFALASAAVVLELRSGTIVSANVALGGVGTKPWRAFAAEEMLKGNAPDDKLFRAAAEEVMKPAQGYKYNAFKIELAKRTMVAALKTACGGLA